MNIRTEVLLTAILILIISLGITLAFTIYSIKEKGKEDVEKYRTEQMYKIKQELRSNVDIADNLIDSNYKNATNKDYLGKYYGHRLKNIIDVAESIVKSKAGKVKSGELSLAQAQSEAKEEIKRMKYDDGTGYIWINDTTKPVPYMIMHPTLPSLDNKIMDDPSYNCALGKGQNLFVAFAEVCEKYGEGYVDYIWPKPMKDGSMPEMPKISYVRLFKDWNWIIGTGIYIDDAVIDITEKIKDDIKNMRYDNGVGYFWINDTAKPVPNMVMHPTLPSLDGKVLDDPNYNCALGKRQNLFIAFAQVCEKDGEGYVDYIWPKPTEKGLTEDMPKLSFVRLYEPLNWIIGTGVYIDSIDEAVNKKIGSIDKQVNSLIFKVLSLSLGIIIIAVVVLVLVINRHTSGTALARKSDKTSVISEEAKELFEEDGRGDKNYIDEVKTATRQINGIITAEQAKLAAFNNTLDNISDVVRTIENKSETNKDT